MLARHADPPRSEGPSRACPSRGRPVDLVHLAAQTAGDRVLEAEILALFAAQLAGLRGALSSRDRESGRAAAHAAVGSARNVGAFPLASAARAFERDPDDHALRSATLDELDRVERFLRGLAPAA